MKAAAECEYSQAALDFVAGRASPSATLLSLAQNAASVAGINELESTVRADVDFSMRTLALANSAFYSPAQEIVALREALIVLGADTVQKLAASQLARSLLTTPSHTGGTLWLHSQAVSVAAQMLAETHRLVDPQQAYVAGLLHDVGLFAALPHEAGAGVPEHGALGAEIADLLGLSPTLSAVIRHHDAPIAVDVESAPLDATVSLANVLAVQQGFRHDADLPDDETIADTTLSSLGLRRADIEELGRYLPERLDELLASIGETAEAAE